MLNNRQNVRRRGRGRGPNPNSGGQRGNESRIDSRARGNAPQMLEKYKNLARDAQMQGDRVMTEYYLQFADHYFRIVAESRARFEEQRRQRDDWQEGDDDGEDGYARSQDDGDDDGDEQPQQAQQRPQRQPRQRDDYRDNGRDGNRDTGRENQQRDNQSRDGQQRDGQQRDGQQRDGRRPRGEGRNEPRRDGRNRTSTDQGGEDRNGNLEDVRAHEPVIDISVLPPALGVMSDPMPDLDDEPAPTPKRRGRPKKVVTEDVAAEG